MTNAPLVRRKRTAAVSSTSKPRVEHGDARELSQKPFSDERPCAANNWILPAVVSDEHRNARPLGRLYDCGGIIESVCNGLFHHGWNAALDAGKGDLPMSLVGSGDDRRIGLDGIQ